MSDNQKFFEYVELFAKEVIAYSTQYNSDGRTAFVADNLAGPPSIYPDFADSTRSCAFLNYGTRWEKYPGTLKTISGGRESHTSTDFVDVFFERPVIVVALQIYETFFPGAVVAIRACYRDQPTDRPVNMRGLYWATLWQAADRDVDCLSTALGGGNSILPASSVRPVHLGRARIFEPILSNIPLVPSDLIRIELDVRRVAYHTQLDAIRVKGYAPVSDEAAQVLRNMQSDVHPGRRKATRRGRTVSCNELEGPPGSINVTEPRRIMLTNCLPAPPEEVDDCCCSSCDDRTPMDASLNVDYLSNSIICPLSMSIDRLSTPSACMALMHQTTLSTYDNPLIYHNCPLLKLPRELILCIFSYFDLPNLLRISSVCRLFYDLSSLCLSRSRCLNLQALWPTTTDSSLRALSRRLKQRVFDIHRQRERATASPLSAVETTSFLYPSWSSFAEKGVTQTATIISPSSAPPGKIRSPVPRNGGDDDANADSDDDVDGSREIRFPRLQRLDLSWCGNYEAISPPGLCLFLSEVGQFLTTLRLSSCQMVDDEALLHIINVCGLLTELDLSSCRSISSGGFVPLGRLIHLQWLSVYRTKIRDAALLNLSTLCQHLRHVNLASCSLIEDADSRIIHLTSSNPQLISLNLWRCHNLTGIGVIGIAENCPNLQQLDLGWCSAIDCQLSNCIGILVSKCRLIRVLSLTGVRSVSPNDLLAMGDCLCNSLENLHLVGNALINEPSVIRLLSKCVNLGFLDISHCPMISLTDVGGLRAAYPNCLIVSNHHTVFPPPFPNPPTDLFFPGLPPPNRTPALTAPPEN